MAASTSLSFFPTTPRFCKFHSPSTHSSVKVSLNSISTNVELEDADVGDGKKFTYSRASPSIRWPHLNTVEVHAPLTTESVSSPLPPADFVETQESTDSPMDEEVKEDSGRASRTRVKKMNKLALKRAKDWRERVNYLTDRILGLQHDQFVADVLEDRTVQMTPTDFCYVVKWVGQASWQRALEVFEWLNLRHWYTPNARMLATVLAVLGKANQVSLAVEIFRRAEPSVGSTVQVYNAMMGVYARIGLFSKVQQLLEVMQKRGCVPDLVSFNTLINARLRSGTLEPNLAVQLLNQVRNAGLRPDIITYNTIISACSRDSNLEEAMKVFNDMETHNCQPDLWTYNSMISVYGRCGMAEKANRLFKELGMKGFTADAVTFNSLLYAYAMEKNIEKVKEICEEMERKGFGRDEMTYNTIILMYCKQGQHGTALKLYRDMRMLGRSPDAVTYTVLIDSLGKANKISEAAALMSEMLNLRVKPTLRTYSAMICGYARAGMRSEAEETFDRMRRSGIEPDNLAYSVMLDVLLRSDEPQKAMKLYQEMIRDGYMPSQNLYTTLFRMLKKEDRLHEIETIIRDMEVLFHMNPLAMSSVLVIGECFDHAARLLKQAISEGYDPEHETLLSILTSYSLSGRHSEALELLEFSKEYVGGSNQFITEALIVLNCKVHRVETALEEYNQIQRNGWIAGGCAMYESLIDCCAEKRLFAEASQIFSDMGLYAVEPSESILKSMVGIYCELCFPETAHHLVNQAERKGYAFDSSPLYTNIIEAYGKAKLWRSAEVVVGTLRKRHETLDRKVWNSLMRAYAVSGCYERARAVFNTMMRDGPSPTVESINCLLQALIVDERLNELYVVIQELQDMGFKISKSSILLMLDAFARVGNLFEVKKIYNGMKAAGYFPNMYLYNTMIELFCKAKHVRDAENTVSEMEAAGFAPDLSIWNSMLKLYTKINDFKRTALVYQKIKLSGIQPDEVTFNTLIIMYCRDQRPEEGFSLMQEMRNLGLEPTLDTYKSLISAYGKQQLFVEAEDLFEELIARGYKLDRSFYHTMMKIYRNNGNHSKVENILHMMKDAGVQPSVATMHLLMLSYGSSGKPQDAENVFANLKESEIGRTTLPYNSVIDAYLKNGEYEIGVQKLLEMEEDGIVPDNRTWTCFIRAASLSSHLGEAKIMLNALQDIGFDLPIRLLTEKSDALLFEVDDCLQKLKPLEDNAALNFVNAIEDLLWAFQLRATATLVFQLAIKRGVYHSNIFRVGDRDWGADFRKLSGGAALVGLTLWLDCMQDASLEGYPESPKSVVLITGTAEYNMVSLEKTLKAFLWEMGSPFLPCKTRTGLLVAKAHSLRMWLKDSPFCLDLELKDAMSLPETNSIQLVEGCFMRSGLVPAFKDINERLGGFVGPKKFSRLAMLSNDKRERVIHADVEGRKQKLEKMMKKETSLQFHGTRARNSRDVKRKFVRRKAVS